MAQFIRKTNHQKSEMSIKDYYHKRNKVLLWNEKGGLGDVYMQRMLFEDVLSYSEDIELYFACLPHYRDSCIDYPQLKEILDSRTINPNDWICCYNTCVTISDRYENYMSPNCADHRSDIWAAGIGIKLKNHEMHFQITDENREKAKKALRTQSDKKIIGIAPVSAMATKSLLDFQLQAIVDEATEHNCEIVYFHKTPVPTLDKNGCRSFTDLNLQELVAYSNECDYIIAVDTAFFHLSGGLKKPLMGIFTFADGKVYGKYFDFVLVQKHRDNGNWACGPCFIFGNCPKTNQILKPCLTEITKEELQDGVKKLLKINNN